MLLLKFSLVYFDSQKTDLRNIFQIVVINVIRLPLSNHWTCISSCTGKTCILNVDDSSRRVAIFKIASLKILKNHLKTSSVKLFLRTDSFNFFLRRSHTFKTCKNSKYKKLRVIFLWKNREISLDCAQFLFN